MKEFEHLGAYGVLINEGKILLIKKVSGSYDGKLDLPGGTTRIWRKTKRISNKRVNGRSWYKSC